MVLANNVSIAHEKPDRKEPRIDGLPEGMLYRSYYLDTGCDLAASCLACPFVLCRYDVGWVDEGRMKRDVAVREMRAAKLGVGYVAEHFNISERTVHRIMKAAAQ